MSHGPLAERVNPLATWDNIVLADETLQLLRNLAAQARHFGEAGSGPGQLPGAEPHHGVVALFTGASGTDKTMAAEVLANDRHVDLYRVHLSEVISKWVGETEKNLRQLFSTAERGDAVLFFDEADALFGKRTRGDDSSRDTGTEADLVIQLLERYRGLSILATSKPSSLGQGFTRRMRFIVAFEVPGQAERERIWAAGFPAGVPTESDRANEPKSR
jgi:SpoVK/Ycf46/Vps4 family AAA+-type ATPase